MSDQILINVGPLTSFNNLTYHTAPKLRELRHAYMDGRNPEIIWDLSNVEPKKMSIAALTAFLSITRRIREFIGYSLPTNLKWDPEVLGFWYDISFFKVANYFDIFKWDERMIGGFKSGKTNPNTRIIFFDDFPPKTDNKNIIDNWKDTTRQRVKRQLKLRCANIFESIYKNESWNEKLECIFAITSAELVVNALLHGQDIAMVGLQRSGVGITVTICDGGVGFPKSMKKNYSWLIKKPPIKNIDAIIAASLMKVDQIGLRRAISDVIDNNGWTIISSFDCEIRWEKDIWNKATLLFDPLKFEYEFPRVSKLKNPAKSYLSKNELEKGYYRIYPSKLVGTRITFELSF